MMPPQNSDFRLWISVFVFTGFINIPTGYQMTNLNQPAEYFRAWIDDSTNKSLPATSVVRLWSVVISMRLVGNVLGVLGAAPLSDVVGRRDALRLASLPIILGDGLSMIAIYAHSVWLLMVGRLILGLGDGICANCIKAFFVEVAPSATRGKVGVFLMISREFGMVLGTIIASSYGVGKPGQLPYIFLISLIFSAPTPFVLGLFPKSPRFLFLTKNDTEGAMKSVYFYQGENNDMWAILNAGGQSKKGQKFDEDDPSSENKSTTLTKSIRLNEIYRETGLRQTFLTATIFGCMVACAGRFVCLNYSSDMFRESGVEKLAAEKTAMVAQLFGFPFLIFTMLSVDRFGRRLVLFSGAFSIILLQCIAMIAYSVQDFSGGSNFGTTITIAIAVGFWVPIMVGSISGLNFVPSELFPQRARSAGTAVALSSMYGFGALTTTVFALLQHYQLGLGVLFLCVPMAGATGYLWFYLPETNQRTVEEISTTTGLDLKFYDGKTLNYGATIEETPSDSVNMDMTM